MDEPPYLHPRTIERYTEAQLALFPPVSQIPRDEKILFTVEEADDLAAAGGVALVRSACARCRRRAPSYRRAVGCWRSGTAGQSTQQRS